MTTGRRLVGRDHADKEIGLVPESGTDSLRLKAGKKADVTGVPV